MKLVLLDIDGTILLTRGIGRHSMALALERVLGQAVTTEGISFSGKTDRQIIREILSASDVHPGDEDQVVDAALDAYLDELPQHLAPERVQVLPGVRELIQALHDHGDISLGLLTGNLKRTAFLKLAAVGLDAYFIIGAFGSDHEDRNHLPPIAIERANELTAQSFHPDDVYVVGDTVHDVTCGRVSGCRTVAVCTGRYARAELEAAEPDLIVDDLSDYQAVVDFICGTETAASSAP